MTNKIINRIVRSFFKRRFRFTRQNLKYQDKFILSQIKNSLHTKFGKEFFFDKIHSIKDFQNKVPLFHYEEFEPRIIEMMKGNKDISYPGTIPMFAKTWGTTSKAKKYVPITYDALKTNHFNGPKEMLSFYCKANPHTNLFSGKTIALGGWPDINPYTWENNIAYISAILQKEVPLLGHMFKEPNLDVAFIPDREKRIREIIKTTKNKNIVSMTGIPPRCLLLMKEIITQSWKEKIEQIRPNFELLITGWTRYQPYKKQFDKIRNSNKVKVRQVYNSSEGFFAVQDSNEENESMRLLIKHGVFYEFIPLEEYYKGNYKALTLHEININQNYVIVITTNAGLRRYVLGDTVQFTSLNPFRIKITGRTKFFIDSFNEHMLVDHVNKAIEITCEKTNSSINEFTAGPNFETDQWKWAHEYIIEFIQEPIDLEEFIEILDQELQLANNNYAAKRDKDVIMQKVIVHKAPQKTFYNWMKENKKLGAQSKVPILMNDRSILDEILEIIK